MSNIKLTLRNIDTLKPAAERFTAWDTEVKGLGLRVTPSGERAYVLKYRVAGQQRWFTIGRHGSPWTPEQARIEAKRLLGEVAKGDDPAAEKVSARKAANFAELVDLYFAEGVAHKKASTIKADKGRARIHLVPLLGKKRVEAITRGDIEALLNAVIAGKTVPKTAQKPDKRKPGSIAAGGRGVGAQCVALASTVLQFAIDRKMIKDNPARSVKKPAVRKMERFLSLVELKALADALSREVDGNGSVYPVAAIRLLALTGCRKGEILGLLWTQVDIGRGLLNLPDSKTGAKAVYLSRGAVELLKNLPVTEGNPYVIAGLQEGKKSGAVDKVWARVRISAGLPGVRIHDLRHTFASVGTAASLGLPIIGKLLGHKQAQTTARYAHLANDPVRTAVDTIGTTIAAAMAISEGANVEPICEGGDRQ